MGVVSGVIFEPFMGPTFFDVLSNLVAMFMMAFTVLMGLGLAWESIFSDAQSGGFEWVGRVAEVLPWQVAPFYLLLIWPVVALQFLLECLKMALGCIPGLYGWRPKWGEKHEKKRSERKAARIEKVKAQAAQGGALSPATGNGGELSKVGE